MAIEKARVKSLDHVEKIFYNLDSAIEQAEQLIGRDGNRHLKASIIPELIENENFYLDQANGVVFQATDVEGKTRDLIKLSKFIYFHDEKINLPGLNQIYGNACLYLSVSPNAYAEHIFSSQKRLIAGGESEFISALNQEATNYVRLAINRLNKNHPYKDVTIIALGERSREEHMDIYAGFCEALEPEFAGQNIQAYSLPQARTGANAAATLYYIDAKGDYMNLTSKDLEVLHRIHRQTVGAGIDVEPTDEENPELPVIIHCQQGLDRTSKVSLAFELFREFEYFFESHKPHKIAYKLQQAMQFLRTSRSPLALGNIADFRQAVYLGLALKAIDDQQNLMQQLASYRDSLPRDPLSKNKFKRLKDILEQIETRETLIAKIDYLDGQLNTNSKTLAEQRTHKELPSFLRPETNCIYLLKALKRSIENRLRIEEQLLPMLAMRCATSAEDQPRSRTSSCINQ